MVPNVDNVNIDTSYYDQHFPFYRSTAGSKRYSSQTPKILSSYSIFKSYLFQPAFDDAASIVETSIGRKLTGPKKLSFIRKIASTVWNQQVQAAIDPQNSLSMKDFDKHKCLC